jgi:acyl-CoA synthetase (AMP-forming)/AMP-acid ligase II
MSIEFANVLRGNGIKPGDVVTVVDSNTIDFVVAFLGVTYARAVAAPLNQNYTTVRSLILYGFEKFSV